MAQLSKRKQSIRKMIEERERQRGTFRIRQDACRKRLKHWATVFSFIPSFIERYWCRAKWFARKNCGYDFEALKATVPKALASVNASIRGFYRLAVRTIDAYSAGLSYGTEEFRHSVYRSHRQVEDKSKW